MGELETDLYRVARPFLVSLTRHVSARQIAEIFLVVCSIILLLFAFGVVVELVKVIAAGDFKYLAKGVGIRLRQLVMQTRSKAPTWTDSTTPVSQPKVFATSMLERYRPLMPRLTRYWLILPAVMLLLAWISSWPYNFYILMRWIVCLTLGHLTYSFYKTKQTTWMVLTAVVCLLFNPFAPFRFDRETWSTFNFISAAFVALLLAVALDEKTIARNRTIDTKE